MFYHSTYLYIRRPMHMSGLLISQWGPAHPFFVGDKYVTPPVSGYIPAAYKSVSTLQKSTPQITTLAPQFTFSSTFLWFKKKPT